LSAERQQTGGSSQRQHYRPSAHPHRAAAKMRSDRLNIDRQADVRGGFTPFRFLASMILAHN